MENSGCFVENWFWGGNNGSKMLLCQAKPEMDESPTDGGR